MKQYHRALKEILENGKTKTDRTGTGTKSIFGYQMRFNLQDGFPAVTTKKLAWNSVVSELLWFLEGSGDERRLCEILHGTRDDSRKTIWSENASADYWAPNAKFAGDLKKVYGYQWRKWNKYNSWASSVTLVQQNTKTGNDKPFYIDFPVESPVLINADDFVGKTFLTKTSGELLILEKLPTRNGNTYYRAQFLDGIKTVVECSRPNVKTGTVKNPYAMIAANGNGCYGIIDKRSSYLTKAYNLWLNMMERCHGSHPIKTAYYKQKGIFVDSEWRCFSNFYRDIHGLVGFDSWSASPSNFDLDKDYFGNTFYGQSTTIFLPSWYNMYILPNPSADGVLYTATNKQTGENFKFTSPAFFNKHTKTTGMVDRAFLNQNGETRTWKFTKEAPPAGYKWRQEFYVDQIANLIKGIKEDPDGRRHIVVGYNPAELDQMALPPCHAMFQMYVADGELSCQLYQRSADFPLGVPFNIASYSLLTHMIAQICNLKVGEFIHSIGDAHIYLNQVDGVIEQLKRDPLPLPTLEMPKFTTLEELLSTKTSDYKLVDYQHHGKITYPFAV